MESPIINIAIADDFPVLVSGLKALLEGAGNNYKIIIEAYNGLDLVSKIEKSPVLPDICLLDISMPMMNGFDALIEIKRRWKSVRIIMQSQFYNEPNIIKAFRNGASSFLPKEADLKDYQNAIDQVFETGSCYSEWIQQNVLPHFYDKDLLSKITYLEMQFLRHCCSDLTYHQIAQQMDRSTRTVETYRDSLFQKIQVKNRTALALFAIKSGIVRL